MKKLDRKAIFISILICIGDIFLFLFASSNIIIFTITLSALLIIMIHILLKLVKANEGKRNKKKIISVVLAIIGVSFCLILPYVF